MERTKNLSVPWFWLSSEVTDVYLDFIRPGVTTYLRPGCSTFILRPGLPQVSLRAQCNEFHFAPNVEGLALSARLSVIFLPHLAACNHSVQLFGSGWKHSVHFR